MVVMKTLQELCVDSAVFSADSVVVAGHRTLFECRSLAVPDFAAAIFTSIEANLRAPFVLMQDFARHLPADRQGLIVNLLDQRVWSLTPHFVSYTISKAALWTLTQTMALALAPRIRVNGIGPGPTLPSPRQTEAQFASQCASVPLKHGSSPQEIGAAVLAMLDLPAMTGQMIALDGGQHLQWSPAGTVPVLEE